MKKVVLIMFKILKIQKNNKKIIHLKIHKNKGQLLETK